MDDLKQGAADLGLVLDSTMLAKFDRLLELLLRGSATQNLTALRKPSEIVQRHFLESIALGARLQERGLLRPGTEVLDLGSGAGFPGLPLRLVWPESSLVLLEATDKKAAFLRSAVAELSLEPTRVAAGRAETLGHDPSLRERQDLVVARAVAALPVLIELALPFLRVGGTLAAVKGSRADEELAASAGALRACGGTYAGQAELAASARLRVLLIDKTSETPERYPRRPGRPASRPLGD